MASSQTICDERGAILVSNGVILTNSIIRRLKNFDISFIYIQSEDENNRGVIEEILYSVSERPDVKVILNQWPKDGLLFKHSLRTAILSLNMGLLKRYNTKKLTTLAMGALLHDYGMDSFIHHDMEHTTKGYAQMYKNQSMDIEIALVCLQHHERYNGSGVPYAFNKTQITELALLVAVVDYYDRLLIEYNDPRKAFFATVEKKGDYFEPGMTDLFGSMLDWARFYGIERK
jgi:HD-GYP domain-containing protein (c-di-GMP phosphodiesterase class II)